MKKFISGIIIGVLLSMSLFVAANPNQIKLIVNGVDITNNFDAKPVIFDGRTMVPARPLAEALGATVEWDGVNRAVIVKNNTSVTANPEKENPIKEIPNKNYKIGDDVQIGKTKLKLNSIYYSDFMPYTPGDNAGFTSTDGEKFAIINFDVITKLENQDDVYFSANNFVREVVANGKTFDMLSSLGSSIQIKANNLKTVIIFVSIPINFSVTSVEFIEPGNYKDKAIVVVN